MKRLILILALGIMCLCPIALAVQDTGSYTTNLFFYKLGRGDWGDTVHGKWTAAMDKADKAIKIATSMKWGMEYPVAGDNFGARQVPYACTVTKVVAVLTEDGAETVDINIGHNADRSSGTDLFAADQEISSTTTGDSFTAFSDATIAADEWVWLEVSANSGVVEGLDVTVFVSID